MKTQAAYKLVLVQAHWSYNIITNIMTLGVTFHPWCIPVFVVKSYLYDDAIVNKALVGWRCAKLLSIIK